MLPIVLGLSCLSVVSEPPPNITRLPSVLSGPECAAVRSAFGERVLQAPSFGSSAVYLERTADAVSPLLCAIVARASSRIGIPVPRFSAPSVTRYGVGQRYGLHHDSVYVNRSATLLVYLNDVPSGGETVFPHVSSGDGAARSAQEDGAAITLERACEEGEGGGLLVKPAAGDAVLWENLDGRGARDDRMRHGSCPVREGDKWVLQLWVHAERSPSPPPGAGRAAAAAGGGGATAAIVVGSDGSGSGASADAVAASASSWQWRCHDIPAAAAAGID
jgi:hypothetical protein